MEKPIQSELEKNITELETNLILSRDFILKKLETVFIDKAVESHIFGSVARQQTDPYSDIDIWFTFKDEDFNQIYKDRFEYYKSIGEILHVCEPPQNAPICGVHSALLIKSKNNCITVVDVYLCPLSTAYITKEGKKLFGIDLSVDTTEGFNPQKVEVDENYRIDFMICFIFGSIKKLVRHNPEPLDGLFRQYESLSTNYNIPLAPLENQEQNLNTLERIIANTMEVANEKQKEVLLAIHNFAIKVIV